MTATTSFTLTGPENALTDALSLQALGCPVEIEIRPREWLLLLSWETGRLHRLLANHPDLPLRIPEWALPEFDVIRGYCDDCFRYWHRRGRPIRCEHAWPIPILPPKMRQQESQNGGLSCWGIVRALAAVGCNPVVRGAFKWRALCPVCRLRGKVDRRVYVERDPETGCDRLSTFCHCGADDILAVLGLWKETA